VQLDVEVYVINQACAMTIVKIDQIIENDEKTDYSFCIPHPVNRDDQHLLAHALASDISVTWQFLSKRTLGFLLRIKLHAHEHFSL
jgi:hypothetical protein